MKPNYIQIPLKPLVITPRKGKAFRLKPAKREEVPKFYRKMQFRDWLANILMYVVGFEEMCKSFIRKGIHHDDQNL